MITEKQIERAAQALVERRGFGWYEDPMEGGQDAYDICLEALDDARTVLTQCPDGRKAMQPHERLIDEKRELDEKLIKLVQFIATSPIFSKLNSTDQNLMRDQRDAMQSYSEALEARIARFVP